MQRDRFAVSRTWLRTSAEDLSVARTLIGSSPSRSAFHAQQAAQFALKAATIALADDHPRRRSLRLLVKELISLGEATSPQVKSDALALEMFYMSTRYPDAVNDGDPAEFVDAATAQTALDRAARVVAYASALVDRAYADDTASRSE